MTTRRPPAPPGRRADRQRPAGRAGQPRRTARCSGMQALAQSGVGRADRAERLPAVHPDGQPGRRPARAAPGRASAGQAAALHRRAITDGCNDSGAGSPCSRPNASTRADWPFSKLRRCEVAMMIAALEHARRPLHARRRCWAAPHGADMLRFSRDDESEADALGLVLAAKAGYNPRAGVTLWKKMLAANKGAPPQWLSTHLRRRHEPACRGWNRCTTARPSRRSASDRRLPPPEHLARWAGHGGMPCSTRSQWPPDHPAQRADRRVVHVPAIRGRSRRRRRCSRAVGHRPSWPRSLRSARDGAAQGRGVELGARIVEHPRALGIAGQRRVVAAAPFTSRVRAAMDVGARSAIARHQLPAVGAGRQHPGDAGLAKVLAARREGMAVVQQHQLHPVGPEDQQMVQRAAAGQVAWAFIVARS